MLPVKKIYVSTKFKSSASESNSNFRFELPQTISLPNNTVFLIDDICIPHAWYNIEADINDRLYIKVINDVIWETTVVIRIPTGNYTGTTLASKLNELIQNSDIIHPLAGVFTVTYNLNQNNITITPIAPYTLIVLSDEDVKSGDYTFDNPSDYNTNNITSINNVLRNTTNSVWNTPGTPYRSNFLDFLTIDNVYLSSPNLGSFSTLGARGESNIIKKIPVTSDFGYMIIDRITSNHDFLDCSKQTLKTLEFNLKDVKGNYIPLHGADVSFSIIFSEYKD